MITVFVAMSAVLAPQPALAAPAITISPHAGGPGTTINISATFFLSYVNEQVNLYFGDKLIDNRTLTVPTNGNFQTSFRVPADALPGAFKVSINSKSNTLATDNFTVLAPAVHLSASGGVVGTQLQATCRGFAASSLVQISADFVSQKQVLGSKLADTSGECVFDLTIPEIPRGIVTLVADDGALHTASSQFEVIPTVSVGPVQAGVGDKVSVTGSGFTPGNQVIIDFNNKAVSVVDVENRGYFTNQFPIPPVQSGYYLITVIDQDGSQRWLTVDVISRLSVSKTNGALGDKVTVFGTGYANNSIITVDYDDVETGIAVSDDTGAFSYDLTVPVSKHGRHTITCSDGVNKGQIDYTVESQPPDIPALLTPKNLATVNSPLVFEWEGVYDVSQPLVYTFEISRTTGFQKTTLVATGLSKSQYSVTPADNLMPNRPREYYYWRVMATDGAGNAGQWSIPLAFHIDPGQGLPLATKIVLGATMLAIIIAWGIVIGRSLKTRKPPAA